MAIISTRCVEVLRKCEYVLEIPSPYRTAFVIAVSLTGIPIANRVSKVASGRGWLTFIVDPELALFNTSGWILPGNGILGWSAGFAKVASGLLWLTVFIHVPSAAEVIQM